jgi:hypothetical protein
LAFPIAASTPYGAFVCNSTDTDYYSLAFASGGTLVIVMLPPANLNYDLELYDGSQSLIGASLNDGDAMEYIGFVA